MRRTLLSLFLCLAAASCKESPAPEAAGTTTTDAPAAATQSAGGAATESPAITAAPVPPPPAAPAVDGPKLRPVDEASSDPSLVAYRNQLLQAVRRADAGAVVALADPKIRTSFGGGGGRAEFRRMLDRPRVYDELETALTHGGTFRGDGQEAFWAPYVYSAWPDGIDAFQSFAVLGENVPLRASADPASPVIATLSHDIVTRTDEEGTVRTADGKTGHVDPRRLRSPVGYRAGFNKVDGQWRLTAFVQGD